MKKSKFQFRNPYLVELNFTENQGFDRTNSSEMEIQNSFNVQIDRKTDENLANVKLTLEVNTENENPPFKIKAVVASDFVWSNDMETETVELMLNLNAPALLLGYMRPIVANVTNASSFPAYNLPFINFKE